MAVVVVLSHCTYPMWEALFYSWLMRHRHREREGVREGKGKMQEKELYDPLSSSFSAAVAAAVAVNYLVPLLQSSLSELPKRGSTPSF